jgi:2-polyprenyl-3-methyl-5-hydroxy-6-metoxy-1,4-benzoquinol methylase
MSITLSPETEKLLSVGFAEEDNPARLNLRSKLTVLTYVRIADEIAQQLPPASTTRILDWGTGAGQMSYLLTKRGYTVTSFDYLEDKKEAANR